MKKNINGNTIYLDFDSYSSSKPRTLIFIMVQFDSNPL